MEERVLASEAIFGFAGWLTSRSEPITLGAEHECSILASLIGEYIDTNNLPRPRAGIYPNNLKNPNL